MRILIVSNNLHIGGVQKALVNMLHSIHTRYDITLLLFHKGGDYLCEIPESVKVIGAHSLYKYLGMTKYDVKSKKDKLLRAFFAGITRIFGRKPAVGIMSLSQPLLRGYDVSISYLHNGNDKLFMGGCNDFVLRHTDSPRKITFLHCDFGKIGANTPSNRRQYPAFDSIAACSDGCRLAFLNELPQLADKTRTVTNFHRFDNIRALADSARATVQKDTLNILTVARLGGEKGVLRAVTALGSLPDTNYHYYIVGDGIERAAIEQYILQNGLSEKITLCGELANPYGYMRACDLLLIPSYSEAAPVVIGESVTLGTPILSTKTSSADEMITARGYGWVCDNSDASLADALSELIRSPETVKTKKTALKNIVPDNNIASTQLTDILEK